MNMNITYVKFGEIRRCMAIKRSKRSFGSKTQTFIMETIASLLLWFKILIFNIYT